MTPSASMPPKPSLGDIPDALVFYPTPEEFEDPLRYIQSIRAEACKSGICKIVPPPTWKPPRVLADDTPFKARTQALHMLKNRGGGNREVLDQIKEKAESHADENVTIWPPYLITDEGFVRDVDVAKLWRIVQSIGGVKQVRKNKLWVSIAKELGVGTDASGEAKLEKQMKNLYKIYVDNWRRDVEGAMYQDDFEVSDSDSESTPTTGVRNYVTRSSALIEDSHSTDEEESHWDFDVRARPHVIRKWSERSLRRRERQKIRESARAKFSSTNNHSDSEWTPGGQESQAPVSRRARKRRRTQRGEARESEDSESEFDFGSMREEDRSISHRIKRTTLLRRLGMTRTLGRAPNESDRINKKDMEGFANPGARAEHSVPHHVKAPLPGERVRRISKICNGCGELLVEQGGKSICLSKECCNEFFDGDLFTIENFRKMAAEFKTDWFRTRSFSKDPRKDILLHDIEHEFWTIIENAAEAVWVQYGADLDTRAVGSGFPSFQDAKGMKRHEGYGDGMDFASYTVHPWNLNNFPNLKGSLLGCLPSTIAGVNSPWLYIGMLFSTFCYHVEDSNMYSINYMHFADDATPRECQGKMWYGLPGGRNALRFEQAIKEDTRELFDARPDVLYDIVTMASPVGLMDRCEVFKLVQRPGEFVITFPQAYHCGFSLGFNVAEAVNFLTADALSFCRAAARRYRLFRRKSAVTPEEIAFLNSEYPHVDSLDSTDARVLHDELSWMIRREQANRKTLKKMLSTMRIPFTQSMLHPSSDTFESCSRCKQQCVWTAVVKLISSSFISEALCLICCIAMVFSDGKKSELSVNLDCKYQIMLYSVPEEDLKAAAQRVQEQRVNSQATSGLELENFSPTDIRFT